METIAFSSFDEPDHNLILCIKTFFIIHLTSNEFNSKRNNGHG